MPKFIKKYCRLGRGPFLYVREERSHSYFEMGTYTIKTIQIIYDPSKNIVFKFHWLVQGPVFILRCLPIKMIKNFICFLGLLNLSVPYRDLSEKNNSSTIANYTRNSISTSGWIMIAEIWLNISAYSILLRNKYNFLLDFLIKYRVCFWDFWPSSISTYRYNSDKMYLMYSRIFE